MKKRGLDRYLPSTGLLQGDAHPTQADDSSAVCRFEDLRSFLRTSGNHSASAHIRETEGKEGKKLA